MLLLDALRLWVHRSLRVQLSDAFFVEIQTSPRFAGGPR